MSGFLYQDLTVARGGIRARAAFNESESGAPDTIGGWRPLLNRYRSAAAAAANFGFRARGVPKQRRSSHFVLMKQCRVGVSLSRVQATNLYPCVNAIVIFFGDIFEGAR